MANATFAVAVFPFLKTSEPVRIGGYIFRSTLDLEGLPPDQERAISEIAQMLFVQDDLHVKSASYAILPDIEVHSGDLRLNQLERLRNVVSYFYAAPHEIFGNVFLATDETSLVLFTPARVSVFLTRPHHHTENIRISPGPEPDHFHNVQGYNGLYNFRHSFWVEPGSRLYGPKPHMTLNRSQDLYVDLQHRLTGRPDSHLLLALLEKPETPASLRIYSALRWFNAANESGLDQSKAILNLAVAFETLLRLPESSKTERLVDAISLLLGRTERLNEWAHQFYMARSQIAHEGEVRDQYFYVGGVGKKQILDIFGSLMLYGRQIFQLCLSTLLVGIDLAERSNLRDKFVTNNERYRKMCELLRTETGTPSEKLVGLTPIIRTLERLQFVTSVDDVGPLLMAVRLAAKTLVECNQVLPDELASAVMACAGGKRDDSEKKQLSLVMSLDSEFKKPEISGLTPEAENLRDIVNLVWMRLFRRYYSLVEHEK